MFFRKFNTLNLLLICIVSLLGANAYKTLSRPTSLPESSSQSSNKTADVFDDSSSVESEKIFQSFYDTVVDKNIFRPERIEWKPPPPPPPPPPAPPKKAPVVEVVRENFLPPNMVLKGIITLDDGTKIAIVEGSFIKLKKVARVVKQQISGFRTETKTIMEEVEEKQDLKDHRLYVGDRIANFKVADILEDRVRLLDYDGEETFLLLNEKKDNIWRYAGFKKGKKIKGDYEEDGKTLFIEIWEAITLKKAGGKAGSKGLGKGQKVSNTVVVASASGNAGNSGTTFIASGNPGIISIAPKRQGISGSSSRVSMRGAGLKPAGSFSRSSSGGASSISGSKQSVHISGQ